MKAMFMVTNKEDPNIPVGKAALCINDSGWFGTNNGFPFAGQPALFPEDQANAILYTWNHFDIHSMPYPEDVKPNVLEWLT